MSAIGDVARLAGVSKSTASRALSGNGYVSETTRKRVVDAARDIGYVASSNAASLVTGRTKNVGVVIPYVNRWFFGEVLDGIESTLIKAGYDLTLYRLSPEAEQRQRVFEYFLVRKRVDAVIAVGIELTGEEIQHLRSLGKPIVGLGGPIEGIPTIGIDDVAAARLATSHLVSLGHRHIMHLGGDQEVQMDFRVHAKRLSGFRQALEGAGIAASHDFRAVEFSIPGGYAAAMEVLADPRVRPTAIFAGCDEIAIGVIVAARQLGIQVPAELSVIGIDGHSLSATFGLTTLRQDPALQGATAATMALSQLAQPATHTAGGHNPIPVTLTMRSSTRVPASA